MPKGKKRKAEETGRGKGTEAGRDRKDVYPKGMRMGVLLHGEDEWFGQVGFERSVIAEISSTYTIAIPLGACPSTATRNRTGLFVEEVQRRRKILEQSKQEMEKSRATIVDLARAHTADSLAAMGEEQLKEILTDRRELDPQRSAEENTVRLCLWLGVALPPYAPPPMLTKKAALAREQERTRHKAQHSLGAGGDTSSESEDSDDSSDSSDLDDRLDGERTSTAPETSARSATPRFPPIHPQD
uniref:Uncharacterized protein n=1 Tax=Schizophyllum commune (strain H4-8 / FGSC 9210) TaxID=578458 RepID=D8QHV9_SCHCM